jgi:hypothetical protein
MWKFQLFFVQSFILTFETTRSYREYHNISFEKNDPFYWRPIVIFLFSDQNIFLYDHEKMHTLSYTHCIRKADALV